jgi:hypothetical protein
MKLADMLRDLREKAGFSQEGLAREANVSVATNWSPAASSIPPGQPCAGYRKRSTWTVACLKKCRRPRVARGASEKGNDQPVYHP